MTEPDLLNDVREGLVMCRSVLHTASFDNVADPPEQRSAVLAHRIELCTSLIERIDAAKGEG